MTLCKDLNPSVNIDGGRHPGAYTNRNEKTDRFYNYFRAGDNPHTEVLHFIVDPTGSGNAEFKAYFIALYVATGGRNYSGRVMYNSGGYSAVIPDSNVGPDGLTALTGEYRSNKEMYDSMALQFWKKAQP